MKNSHPGPSDSKYGFHNQNGNGNGPVNNESVDDLPLPPHPNQVSPQKNYNSPTKNGGGGPNPSNGGGGSVGGPNVPPKIERHKKPNRSPREGTKHNSLDRPAQLNNMKMSVYDAYDPYTAYDSSPRYKSSNPPSSRQPDPGYRSSASLHDPAGYRAPQRDIGGHEQPGYRAPSYQDPGYRAPNINGQDHPGYRVPNMQQHQQQDTTNPGGYNRPNFQNG